MEQGQIEQVEALLGCLSVGIAVLDSTDLRIHYLNSYLYTQLDAHWHLEDVVGRRVDELLPEEIHQSVLTCLHAVIATGTSAEYAELPYEGFLQTRGRTYWHVTIMLVHAAVGLLNALLVTVEDVTERVRSRLQVNAIKYISSAIVGVYALPPVLDRILHSVCDMIGSTKCAVFLIEHSLSNVEEAQHTSSHASRRAVIAAQKGIHVSFQEWRPIISQRLLLGRVMRERRTVMIADTTVYSDLDLPFLDDSGMPRPPGSALCIPIFEPHILRNDPTTTSTVRQEKTNKVVLGSIEVYHRHARGFSPEEIELLEQIAQQAGLAIQNARLFYNIDQLVRAEQRTARQRAYVVQAIPDGVIIFDPRWRVAETNQAIRTLLGWNDTIIGQTVTQALQQSKATLYYDILHLADPVPELERRAYTEVIDEFKMISADGQHYTIRCTYTPIRDDLGDTFAFVVIYHDVTEQTTARERIEAEVVERTKEIKALERAREDFFTTMAHELKTPLANIRAHLSALLTNDLQWSLEEQHASLLTADQQVERLVEMVNQVLNASRIEARALHLNLEAVLLPELFEDLEERLEALIGSSQRYLHIKRPDVLPAVQADYELIMRVLINLLSNAFRYAPEGDAVLLEATCVFDAQDTDQIHPIGVTLCVSDRGQGIPQEQQKMLFTRFSTLAPANNAASDRTGLPEREQRQGVVQWSPTTGLGLYISRGIVEAHNSQLTLESSPGHGARFSFTLPTFQNVQ